jgi:inhibitor of KinA sporulation pathway (predicted exonuclease)
MVTLCFLDFEANCSDTDRRVQNEIIEFPMIIPGRGEFHAYVRPEAPLTPFCTQLTGITQATVDNAAPLKEVLAAATLWLQDVDEVVFVTCGNWDLNVALPRDCARKKLKVPKAFKRFLNLKDVVRAAGLPSSDMAEMLAGLGLEFEGRPHSGIDDTRNMVAIWNALEARSPIVVSADMYRFASTK